MESMLAIATIRNDTPATVATWFPFVNVSCTDDARPGSAALGVAVAMTTTAVVALTTEHDAASVPLLGVAPTLATHAKPVMKLVPVTVIVLPA